MLDLKLRLIGTTHVATPSGPKPTFSTYYRCPGFLPGAHLQTQICWLCSGFEIPVLVWKAPTPARRWPEVEPWGMIGHECCDLISDHPSLD